MFVDEDNAYNIQEDGDLPYIKDYIQISWYIYMIFGFTYSNSFSRFVGSLINLYVLYCFNVFVCKENNSIAASYGIKLTLIFFPVCWITNNLVRLVLF